MSLFLEIVLSFWLMGLILCLLVRDSIRRGVRECGEDTYKKFGIEMDEDDHKIFEIMNAAPWFFLLIAVLPIINYAFAWYLAITHPKKVQK
jgi:ABC-type microcin C transport system permease subunit YejE